MGVSLLYIVMSGCSPLLGAGSLVHAVVTGNTTAQIIGATDIVIEKNTGKSVREHVWNKINTPNTIEKQKTIKWHFVQMENESSLN